ncbi:Na(+)/H(+) antiporter subunit D [Bauldia sp.]|uniref:Na(+)/H(+) antiporter subunit D n=1 Tax=Bauldia sp. TaxID=2575872 RepID=UPI003BAC5B78
MTPSLGLLLPVLLPGLVLIAAGIVLIWLRGTVRDAVILAAPLVVLALIWSLPDGARPIAWLGYELVPFRSDALSRLFGTVFCLAVFGGGLFALRQERLVEIPLAFMYGGSSLGVIFAGDLITVFVFWELMAICSTMIVWIAGKSARAAGQRYIVIHLLGGVLLMAGIAGHIGDTGSIAFTAMSLESPAAWLILAGFLINAGAWPVSAWLPDAYPQATWSGTVFLSAFTTKTAVYVLLRGFPGAEILIWLGLIMMFYGIIYAIRENDIRRLLSYSIVSQVGFMVTAIGVGNELALNGAAAHAFIHIIYKALLLMSAGSVMMMTGRTKMTELGGLYATMPITAICGIIGALSISAFPLTSGFISKSMISDGVGLDKNMVVWLLLTAASAGSFLYAGLKLPWFVFFNRTSDLRPPDPPLTMRAAMILFSALCIGIGIFPAALFAILPFPVDSAPYSASHVITQLQLLLFAALAFVLMLGWLRPAATVTLDVDWFWRRGGPALVRLLNGKSGRAAVSAVGRVRRTAERAVQTIYRHHGPAGVLARAWPTGSMAFWAVFLLAAYMLFYYLR